MKTNPKEKQPKLSVMVVDDEVNIVDVIKSFLEMEGYVVYGFTDPQEAIEFADRFFVDIVLTDLHIGKVSGVEVFKRVHAVNPDTLTILMTAYPTLNNAIEVLRMGVYDYILKPFSMETLMAAITRAADSLRLSREVVQLKEAVSLYQISEAMGSTIAMNELLDVILGATLKELDADYASLAMKDLQTEELAVTADYGKLSGADKVGSKPEANSFIDWVVSNNQPLIMDGDAKGRPYRGITNKNVKSAMCAPIRNKGEVVGAITVVRVSSRVPFSKAQLHALVILTNHAAQAINNARLYELLYRDYVSIIMALSNAVEAKDPFTQGHSARVVKYSLAVGKQLGLPEETLDQLKVASLLHDVGKIGIPDHILLKPGKLTDEEYELMKQHPAIGDRILEPIKSLETERKWIYQHHERFDGEGYPDGVDGSAMSLPAKIMIACEIFDALTTERSYKKAWPLEEVRAFFVENAGTHFDPVVAEALLKHIDAEGESWLQEAPPDLLKIFTKRKLAL